MKIHCLNRALFSAIGSFFPLFCLFTAYSFAGQVKEPDAAGTFYPSDPLALSRQVDGFISQADPGQFPGRICALICPHAGYEFSGAAAAFGYKLIKDRPFKTVVILGPSHFYAFKGISVYPGGVFRTPLGDIEVDGDLSAKLLNNSPGITFVPQAFTREHSVEVQLPFLQRALKDFKIVPVVFGDCDLPACRELAGSLKAAIGGRSDVLVIVSTDMYHGYDHEEADIFDDRTLTAVSQMDGEGLYNGLRDGKFQLCGGLPAVTALLLAKGSGCDKIEILKHTNSARVTHDLAKGKWTVGYSSVVIGRKKEEVGMLSKDQKKRLLAIARASIETYLTSGKKLQVKETDPGLNREMGAFVTLHESGQLRGCIGNIVGTQPLYLTVRDMAVEAATGDPRFSPVLFPELRKIEIEISALSELEKVDSPDKIILGKHGVIVRRGFNSGVFLPQVATETGWTREQFLSELCSQKAGLPPECWKDRSTELQVFSAEVFSEKEY